MFEKKQTIRPWQKAKKKNSYTALSLPSHNRQGLHEAKTLSAYIYIF